MTTIAADRKCMAADSQVTDGDTVYHTSKLHIIGDTVYGVGGLVSATNMFLDWVRNGRQKDGPTLPEDDDAGFCALALNRRGLFLYVACASPDKLDDKFYAIGTGKQAAIGCLRMGGTPAEAVAMARDIDPFTGGKIRIMQVAALPKAGD